MRSVQENRYKNSVPLTDLSSKQQRRREAIYSTHTIESREGKLFLEQIQVVN